MPQNIDTDQFFEFVTNHHFLFIGLAIVTFLLIQDIISGMFRQFRSTSPMGAITLLNEEDAAVVDVSEPFDYKKGHIIDAINIPVAKFDELKDKLKPLEGRALIVACQSGNRSNHAGKKLTALGFEKVFILQGGMQAWLEDNLPIEKTK